MAPKYLQCATLALLLWISSCPGCGPSEQTAGKGDIHVTVDTAAECPAPRRTPGADCCPPGSFYEFGIGTCQPVGPTACEALLFSDPLQCRPRWCGTWGAETGCANGQPNSGCWLDGDACFGDTPGCEAGWWPDPDTAVCRPAGLPGTPAPAAGDPAPPLSSPVGVASPLSFAAVGASHFCAHDGHATLCPAQDAHCGPGAMPAGGDDTAPCMPVGVPWSCPPGFVVDPAAPGSANGAVACKADPAECGPAPFGNLTSGQVSLFVDPEAPGGGDGSLKAPLRSLAEAVNKAPAGAEIVLAAGTYAGAALNRAVTLRGRCAAMVTFDPGPEAAAISVELPIAAVVHLSGLRLRGGWGLGVFGAAMVSASGIWLDGIAHGGVWVKGPAASLHLEDSLLSDTGTAVSVGVFVDGGAYLNMRRVRVSGTHGTGLAAFAAGSRLEATEVLVDDGQSHDEEFGGGIEVGEGAHATLSSVRVKGNRAAGILVVDPGTKVSGRGLVVDATRATAKQGHVGLGMYVAAGASVELDGARLHDSQFSGLVVVGAQTKVVAHGLVVDLTSAPATQPHAGHGVMVDQRGSLALHSARISQSHSVGLSVSATGTEVVATGLLVDDTQADSSDQRLGLGVEVLQGARLVLRQGRLHANRTIGMRVRHAGSEVRLDSVLVDGTLAQPVDGELGLGIDIDAGARLFAVSCRLSGNRAAGLRANGPGTQAFLAGTLIDGTELTGLQQHGSGVDGAEGAYLRLAGCRVTGNRTAGVLLTHTGTSARLAGSVVEQTRPTPSDFFGLGVGAMAGARLMLEGSAVTANRGVGVQIDSSEAELRQSIIADTRPSQAMPFGSDGRSVRSGLILLADGLVARAASSLHMDRVLVVQQDRCGLLVDGGGDLRVRHTFVTGGVFGLATQNGATVQSKALLLYDNSTNRASEQILPVPAPPVALAP